MKKLLLGIFLFICLSDFVAADIFFNADKIDSLVTASRMYLYEGRVEDADSLMQMVDFLKLEKLDLGYYYLTNSFLNQKKGNQSKAAINIQKAMEIFQKYGKDKDKAEANLIWGIFYEGINLPDKAAESYFDGLKYYQDKKPSKIQLYLLLGLVKTASEKDYFLNEAEEILPKLNNRNDSLLYYKAKAYSEVDIKARHLLYLRILNDYTDLFDSRGRINLYGSLAVDCQVLGKNDSANYYLAKAEQILKESDLSNLQLIHYFFIKVYIDTKSGRIAEAERSIDLIIDSTQSQPGLLSQAYLRKSHIQYSQKKYADANTSLLRHVKYEKEKFMSIQDNQISLLTIRYKLNQQEVELLRIRNFWLTITIGLFVAFFILSILFLIQRRKVYHEKQALKDLVSITSAERLELERKFHFSRDLLHKTAYANEGNQKDETLKYNKPIIPVGLIGTYKEWKDFRSEFIYQHPLFFERLKKRHPDLNALDFKYCFCIFSRLTIQQTANIHGVTYDAVKKARSRLKNKFSLNTVDELPIYLESIDQQIIDLHKNIPENNQSLYEILYNYVKKYYKKLIHWKSM